MTLFFYILLTDLQSFTEQVTVFRNIAAHYSMNFLLETIDWILRMNA